MTVHAMPMLRHSDVQTPWRERRDGRQSSGDSEDDDLVSVPAAQVHTRVTSGECLEFPPLESIDPPCPQIERVSAWALAGCSALLP